MNGRKRNRYAFFLCEDKRATLQQPKSRDILYRFAKLLNDDVEKNELIPNGTGDAELNAAYSRLVQKLGGVKEAKLFVFKESLTDLIKIYNLNKSLETSQIKNLESDIVLLYSQVLDEKSETSDVARSFKPRFDNYILEQTGFCLDPTLSERFL